jgi:hypothetical protein
MIGHYIGQPHKGYKGTENADQRCRQPFKGMFALAISRPNLETKPKTEQLHALEYFALEQK